MQRTDSAIDTPTSRAPPRAFIRRKPGFHRPLCGFTLVELVVVLTIMAVLMAFSAPRFTKVVEQSRADFAVANLRAIWTAERLYWLEYHTYTDQLSTVSSIGLYNLGLLDPAVISSTGDYTYAITSADSNSFEATATRSSGTSWSGSFSIDESGVVTGSVTSSGSSISAGFQ